MTWRERIERAIENGRWTGQDIADFADRRKCLAAEVAHDYSVAAEDIMRRCHNVDQLLEPDVYDPSWPWSPLWHLGDLADIGGRTFDPEGTSKLLDRIEDLALEIKRSLTTPEAFETKR